MDVTEDSTRKEDDAYIGTDPIYQNHAYDTDKPMSTGTVHEQVATEWEESIAITDGPLAPRDLSVDQTPVSNLSEAAGDVPPAFTTGDDGVTVFTAPVLAAEVAPPSSSVEQRADEDEGSAPDPDDDPEGTDSEGSGVTEETEPAEGEQSGADATSFSSGATVEHSYGSNDA